MAEYPYPRINAGGYDLAQLQFSSEVNTALPGVTARVCCDPTTATVVTGVVLDAGQEATLAALAASYDGIVPLQEAKNAAIDRNTGDLIVQGFQYPPTTGLIFSLSPTAQTNLLGLESAADNPAFTYPVDWNSIDDEAVYEIPDAATAHLFYLTALGTIRAWKDSGTALKDQVRAATTPAEVAAVVDNR